MVAVRCGLLLWGCSAGYTQDRFYIHCDGALFGMMMPFIKEVSHQGLGRNAHSNNVWAS